MNESIGLKRSKRDGNQVARYKYQGKFEEIGRGKIDGTMIDKEYE
jgi:hypothetical protein